jgi:hypothetical protein
LRADAALTLGYLQVTPLEFCLDLHPSKEGLVTAGVFNDVIWDGITKADGCPEGYVKFRQALADPAQNDNSLKIRRLFLPIRYGNPDPWLHYGLVNCCGLNDRSLSNLLHQSAQRGSSKQLVRWILQVGAWRTLRNAKGERPVDIARELEYEHLFEVLEPVLLHQVPRGDLMQMQKEFHNLLRERIEEPIRRLNLRLPELEPLLELKEPKMFFFVPEEWGSFTYWLDTSAKIPKLVSESRCYSEGGRGQRHVITAQGAAFEGEI